MITICFTIEYLVRLYCVDKPRRYARSFYGIVDLLAILPTYLSVLFPGAQSLLVIRGLRLLRVFRVLKLVHFVGEASELMTALRASARKIIVFLGAVLTIVIIVGSAMYLIEGAEHGFENIPVSIYWAIVTMTTVGYGDMAPETPLGKALASVIMILGYGIIAVPTGIVSVELAGVARRKTVTGRACPGLRRPRPRRRRQALQVLRRGAVERILRGQHPGQLTVSESETEAAPGHEEKGVRRACRVRSCAGTAHRLCSAPRTTADRATSGSAFRDSSPGSGGGRRRAIGGVAALPVSPPATAPMVRRWVAVGGPEGRGRRIRDRVQRQPRSNSPSLQRN